MIDKKAIAQRALTAALRTRRDGRIKLAESLCAFDFAEANGAAEVRFVDIPSLEEFYWKDARMILVSSQRPPGRQAYNCAHGFGHHVFGHGQCIAGVPSEKLGEQRPFDPDEFLVDCFAGFLLMPSSTVSSGFTSRGWNPRSCAPNQVFTVASWLGVGYSTLVQHMLYALRFISRSHAETLLDSKPKEIRAQLIGEGGSRNVYQVDEYWHGRPVDVEVGDTISLASSAAFWGTCLELLESDAHHTVLRGTKPGDDGRIWLPGTDWAIFARVSRRGFVGRNLFRHLEDPDYGASE